MRPISAGRANWTASGRPLWSWQQRAAILVRSDLFRSGSTPEAHFPRPHNRSCYARAVDRHTSQERAPRGAVFSANALRDTAHPDAAPSLAAGPHPLHDLFRIGQGKRDAGARRRRDLGFTPNHKRFIIDDPTCIEHLPVECIGQRRRTLRKAWARATIKTRGQPVTLDRPCACIGRCNWTHADLAGVDAAAASPGADRFLSISADA